MADEASLARYHKSRDALGLSLEDETGRRIRTGAIHIADYSTTRGGGIEVEVLISDRDWWRKRETQVT